MHCKTAIILALTMALSACSAPATQPPTKPAAPSLTAQQLDLITTYCVYAKTIWHSADGGGYWGDGVNPKANQNGAVRGTCNTLLGYALLIHAIDNDMLDDALRARLTEAGLTRAHLLGFVCENLRYLVLHHESNPKASVPTWGHSWQSPLWLSAAGAGALLVWNELPADVKAGFSQVAFSEADRMVEKRPKTYRPGDTGAEENAWDLSAPAVALAIAPKHANAEAWWRAARVYAVNVYSTPADRTSNERVGTDKLRDLISTTNLFDDFTLENHGFFHPDYLQVSAASLGEARMILALGDRIHGGDLATQFDPYAMHHVADVWQRAMRMLVLPSGSLTFPCGTDWTMNCGFQAGYLAWISLSLGDPAAIEAERRLPTHALRHRALSPAGRILGDTNLEWWWEPLIVQRMSMAILQRETKTAAAAAETTAALANMSATQLLPAARVWVRRNSNFFVSAAWGKKTSGTFTPFYSDYVEHPYITAPTDSGILPADVETFESSESVGDAVVLQLKLKTGGRCALVCFDKSVLWLSPKPLRPLAIENDRLSGAPSLKWNGGGQVVPQLTKADPIRGPGNWMNVNDRLGLIAATTAFRYTLAGGYNRKSVAMDNVVPEDGRAWQMVAGATAEQTRELAGAFAAKFDAGVMTVTLRDGAGGRKFKIVAPLDASAGAGGVTVQPID